MINVLMIADKPGWCFSHRAGMLQKYAPVDIDVRVCHYIYGLDHIPWHDLDVVVVMPGKLVGPIRAHIEHIGARAKVLACHNSGLGRRIEHLMDALLSADYVVINNYAVWAETIKLWRPDARRQCNISNGVDTTVFKVTRSIEDRAERILWLGSEMKLAPQENDVKGWYRVLEPLQTIFRNNGEFETDFRLLSEGEVIYSPQELADWYNTGAYVICPSTSEGTPNFLLEAAACGCVPVTGNVGNVPELFGHGVSMSLSRGKQTYRFINALRYARQNRIPMAYEAAEAVAHWDWCDRAAYYYQLFRALAAGQIPKPWTRHSGSASEVCPLDSESRIDDYAGQYC